MTDNNTLENLYDTHTRNVSDKWSSYLTKYDKIFSPYRDMPVRLVEIGIQNGGSLEIWSEYFYNAQLILGCDINPKCAVINHDSSTIKIIIGDINKQNTLKEIYALANELDIVIDDGSHVSSDIINTFCKLFPLLSSEGVYVVEDLHCSYWQQFDGGLYTPHSSIGFFKSLIDILNFEHWGLDISRRSHLESFNIPDTLSEKDLSELHSIEFTNSMCVITKRSKDSNLLGKRKVVGRTEAVSPVMHVADTYNQTPAQSLDDVIAPKLSEVQQQHLIRTQQDRIKLLEVELLQARADLSIKKTND